MPFRIEFVFLTESCQVMKLSLFDPRWPKEMAINQRMQMKEDNKVTLKLESGDTECVLLKHGPPAAMNAEFEKFGEIYSAFSEQCERDLLSAPTRGTRWTCSATGTPENISQTPGTLVRVILVLYWFRLVKLERRKLKREGI